MFKEENNAMDYPWILTGIVVGTVLTFATLYVYLWFKYMKLW